MKIYSIRTRYDEYLPEVIEVEAEEKPKTYRIKGSYTLLYRDVVKKSEIGHDFFLSREDAIRSRLAYEERVISGSHRRIELAERSIKALMDMLEET